MKEIKLITVPYVIKSNKSRNLISLDHKAYHCKKDALFYCSRAMFQGEEIYLIFRDDYAFCYSINNSEGIKEDFKVLTKIQISIEEEVNKYNSSTKEFKIVM